MILCQNRTFINPLQDQHLILEDIFISLISVSSKNPSKDSHNYGIIVLLNDKLIIKILILKWEMRSYKISGVVQINLWLNTLVITVSRTSSATLSDL